MAIPEKPKLNPLPLPDEPGLLGGWGRKLELTLFRFLLDTFNAIATPFWEMRDSATKWLFQGIEEELKPVIEPLLDKIDATPNLPPEIKRMTNHLRFSEPITFAAIASACIMTGVVGLFMGMIDPFRRLMSQETDSYVHSARMTPQEAFIALNRKAISDTDYHNHLSDGGWSEDLEKAWKMIMSPLLDVGDLGRLYQRGILNETEFHREMAQKGYQMPEIDLIEQLLHVIPPLVDIIRMAVREAFTPDIVEQFQLHAELPAEMVKWAKKQGLSREWSEAYWASHWTLPGLSLGYEMLHRGEITDEEMALLIKAQDVSPFWRDKLINISYSPYTRVDVRRMFATGTIGRPEVKRTYLDLGYNEEKAENLTNFTVALANATERDLTKTDVMYGYEVGYFGDEEFDTLIISLGYDQAEADFYRAKINFKRWQAVVKETVRFIGLQYMANQIDQAEVYAQLGALNLPAEQMNRYIREWDLRKKAKTKQLTTATLIKFKKKEIITSSEFVSEMSGLGYSEKYVKWYVESMS